MASRSRALPDEVAAYVRELIFSGEVRPGDFLRLEPIALAVGVSNTPVREGLLALKNEGLVTLVPRRGFRVEPFTPQDIHDTFWAQARLAGELAARAAKKITPEQLTELETIMRAYNVAVETGNEEQISELGHAFHRLINRAAGSHRLALILGSIVQHLPNRFYAAIEGHADETRHDHHKIVEALRSGNVRETRRLIEDHLMESSIHLIALLEQRGLWSEEQTA